MPTETEAQYNEVFEKPPPATGYMRSDSTDGKTSASAKVKCCTASDKSCSVDPAPAPATVTDSGVGIVCPSLGLLISLLAAIVLASLQ